MKFHSLVFLIASAVVLPAPVSPIQAAVGGLQPAMIGAGADSIASKLHYPPKERAASQQAAVAFNCEVRTDGKPSQIEIRCDRKLSRFGDAVYVALRVARFVPAQAGGKVVPVTIGGTVLFTIDGGKPTIAISLATAEQEKIASRQNYIQPQMIGGPEFRRKLFSLMDQYLLEYTKDTGAEVLAQVDAQGNLTGTKLLAEAPPNGGWGRLLLEAMEGQKFIPAMKSGQFVAGAFNLILNVNKVRDPDAAPRVGTLIKDGDVR